MFDEDVYGVEDNRMVLDELTRNIEKLDAMLSAADPIQTPPRAWVRETQPAKKTSPRTRVREVAIRQCCLAAPIDDKTRETIRFICTTVATPRDFVDADDLYRWSIEMAGTLSWRYVETKDRFTVVLFLVYISATKNGISLDPNLLSAEFGIPFRAMMKIFYDCVPPVTTKSGDEWEVARMFFQTPRTELIPEYKNVLRRVLHEDFRVDVQTRHLEEYAERCNHLFGMEALMVEEKQFCITPTKIYVYAIYEFVKGYLTGRTEKEISEYISRRFMVPRVTVDKMKRLVRKCEKKYLP